MRADRAAAERGAIDARLVLPALLLLAVSILAIRGGDPPPADASAASAGHDTPPDVALAHYERDLAETGASREVVAVPGASHADHADDPEWRTLPVTTFSFPRSLAQAPGPLDVRWLYRNRTLNPDDRYLPPSFRRQLQQEFATRKADIVRSGKWIDEVENQEVEDLVANGTAVPVHYADYVRRLGADARQEHDRRVAELADGIRRSAEANGFAPAEVEARIAQIRVFDPLVGHGFRPFASRRVGDAYHAFRLADLPRTNAAMNAWRGAILDCVRSLGGVFRDAGALADDRLAALLAATERATESK